MRAPALSLLVALLLVPAFVHAQQYTPLAQRMSEAEFKATGLDRLSPQQLQALDGWLRTHDKPTTRVVDTSGKPVFYPDKAERRTIQAHLAGDFGGWSGDNELTLDNGQRWREIGSDTVSCNSSHAPAVTIRPSLFGNWLMHVDGCDGSAHVKRVR